MTKNFIIAIYIIALYVIPVSAQDKTSPSDQAAISHQVENNSPVPGQKELSPNNRDGGLTGDKNNFGKKGDTSFQKLDDKGISNKPTENASYQNQNTPAAGADVQGNQGAEKNEFNANQQNGYQNTTYDYGSNTYNSSKLNDNQSNWGLIALFIAIISLCITSYNYKTLHPKKDSKKGRHSRQQDPSSERGYQDKIKQFNNELQTRIVQLEHQAESIKTHITTIELELQRISRTTANSDVPYPTSIQKGNGSNNYNPNNDEKKLYASQVLSDGFPEEGVAEENNDYAIAILSVKGDSGTFIINDRTTAQSFLISNFAYGAGRVSDVKLQGESPTRIETIQSGKIHREANSWKILNNAQVKLV